MKSARIGIAAALTCVSFALSCAGGPQAPASIAAPAAASAAPASTAAVSASIAANPAAKPAAVPAASGPTGTSAGKAAPADAAGGTAGPLPELSFPRRSPLPQVLILASPHEPTPPEKKTALAKAPPPASTPAPTPTSPPQQAVPQPAAVEASKNKESPSITAAPAASSAAATTPKAEPALPKANEARAALAKAADAAAAKPSATASAAAVIPSPEPKNAASPLAQTLALDPASEKKPDIGRNFSAVEGTKFEIPFEGTGWTYLGQKGGDEGIRYDSRRFVGNSLVFILNPFKAGDYLLRFQRQDLLRGISYEELVGVSVVAKTLAATPRSSAGSPTASAGSPTASAGSPTTSAGSPTTSAGSPTTSAGSPTTSAGSPSPAAAPSAPVLDASSLATPEAALAAARSELAAGRAQGALEALDRLIALAPSGTDEAFALYARALELTGPRKDIKRAYAYYRKLRDEYPESPYWEEAAARASYIERHYFDIR